MKVVSWARILGSVRQGKACNTRRADRFTKKKAPEAPLGTTGAYLGALEASRVFGVGGTSFRGGSYQPLEGASTYPMILYSTII